MKGQALLEYLIMLSIVFTIWAGVTQALKATGSFKKFSGSPGADWPMPSNSACPRIKKRCSPHHPTDWSRHSTKLRSG